LDIRNFLAFQYEKRQAYELLASSLKWPVFTCPQVAGFARPLTSANSAPPRENPTVADR
jgi:hypothetical protein